MKTLILSLVLIIGVSATNHGKPINDIYSIKEPAFEEEDYINDIPFNTWEIAVEAILDGDEVRMDEEPYVDDIPFNTREVACKHLLKKMLETSGEANVNDIPFSTEKVLCEMMAARLIELYRNEKNINDLPSFETNYIICSNDHGKPSYVTVKVRMPKKDAYRQKRIESSEYTIIFPVKLEVPRVEEGNQLNHEVLVFPGFSL